MRIFVGGSSLSWSAKSQFLEEQRSHSFQPWDIISHLPFCSRNNGFLCVFEHISCFWLELITGSSHYARPQTPSWQNKNGSEHITTFAVLDKETCTMVCGIRTVCQTFTCEHISWWHLECSFTSAHSFCDSFPVETFWWWGVPPNASSGIKVFHVEMAPVPHKHVWCNTVNLQSPNKISNVEESGFHCFIGLSVSFCVDHETQKNHCHGKMLICGVAQQPCFCFVEIWVAGGAHKCQEWIPNRTGHFTANFDPTEDVSFTASFHFVCSLHMAKEIVWLRLCMLPHLALLIGVFSQFFCFKWLTLLHLQNLENTMWKSQRVALSFVFWVSWMKNPKRWIVHNPFCESNFWILSGAHNFKWSLCALVSLPEPNAQHWILAHCSQNPQLWPLWRLIVWFALWVSQTVQWTKAKKKVKLWHHIVETETNQKSFLRLLAYHQFSFQMKASVLFFLFLDFCTFAEQKFMSLLSLSLLTQMHKTLMWKWLSVVPVHKAAKNWTSSHCAQTVLLMHWCCNDRAKMQFVCSTWH